jgi:hypothetical protein
MKKLATIIGLLSLMLVVTSFTTASKIGGGKDTEVKPVAFNIGGGKDTEVKPVAFNIGGGKDTEVKP